MTETTKVQSSRLGAAEGLVQHPGGSAVRASAGAAPRHEEAGRAGRPGAALPDGPHPAGGLEGALDRDPRPRARRAQAVAAVASLPCPAAGGEAPDARPHLLQARGREPRGLAQAQHLGRAGVLQQGSGHPQDRHRDRGRPVGQRARLRGPALRHRDQGLHGAGELRPEALPPQHDGDLGRQGRRLAQPRHERRPQGPGRGPEVLGLARSGDQRGRRGRGHQQDAHQVLARLGAQPRADAPDGDRARDQEAAGDGRRLPRRAGRLHRRRQQLRGLHLPVPAGQAHRQGAQACASSRSSRPRRRA